MSRGDRMRHAGEISRQVCWLHCRCSGQATNQQTARRKSS